MTCVRQHYQANFGWSELISPLSTTIVTYHTKTKKKTYHFDKDQDPACDFSADPDQEQYFPAMRIRMCNTDLTSVADPRCLSRSWILKFIHSGSRVPNLGSWIQQRGGKNWSLRFFCSQKYYKIKNYFIFEQVHLSLLKRKYGTFYPKNCRKAFRNMGMGSRIRVQGL